MEFYRNEPATVRLEVPAGIVPVPQSYGAIDVKAVDERGRVLFTFATVGRDANGFYTSLPWSLYNQDREFYITWEFAYDEAGVLTTYKDRTYVQVVTPLLPISEVQTIAAGSTDADARELERRVRYAIQAYTGQNFGKFSGVMQVSGNGSNKLMLPAPLLEFRGVLYDGVLRPNYGVSLINNGWAIQGGSIIIDNIKQAPPEWMLDRFDYTGKIYAPMRYGHHVFIDGIQYTVDGIWGYPDVPGDVRQAARLLIQDYSCDESLWRDRYIDSVRAGDWRFEFNAQAFAGTGNVQADQILSGYRRATMVVV